jgi:two-component system chemotaxis response regulator CheB
MKNVRVLVVDDSSFVRRTISAMLEADPSITVIGVAVNGQEAVEMAVRLRPDVVTLDVLMPVMDGIEALKLITARTNARVVMVSSVTQEGAAQTIEALSLGAVDFIAKPSGPISLDIKKIRSELISKVLTAYECKSSHRVAGADAARKFKQLISDISAVRTGADDAYYGAARDARTPKELVAVAASTGGPAALQVVLAGLPANLPAGVVIVQHIAPGFDKPLSERLNDVSPLEIRICRDSEPIRPGVGLVAPTGRHLTVRRHDRGLYAVLESEPSDTLHRPSADVLFHSVAKVCGPRACAVILTGMGDDGAAGMRAVADSGGFTIAQDEATSVIFGMPRAAVEKGGVRVTAPLEEIPARILACLPRS